MANCACPPCDNSTAKRIHKKLNTVQQLMLGYFCFHCIMAECKDKHNVPVR